MDISLFIGLVVAAGSVMGGCIAYQFRLIITTKAEQAKQGEDLGELRGRQTGIAHLSAQVLQTVHDAVSANGSPPPSL